MTFRIADPDALYPTTVEVSVPGAGEPQECEIEFRLRPPEALQKLLGKGDEEYLRGIVGGWSRIEGADGKALEYSDENLATLAALPYFVRSVLDAYDRFLLGLPGKTSAQPRATGAAAQRAATT